MVCHTTPNFTSVYITFVNSKSGFKASGRPNILHTTTFAGYQINSICSVTLQNFLNFIFPLGSKSSKVRRNYWKVLANVTFSITFFCRTFICLVLLGNNGGHKISLRFLIFFVCDTYGILPKNVKHLLITV